MCKKEGKTKTFVTHGNLTSSFAIMLMIFKFTPRMTVISGKKNFHCMKGH